METAIPVVGRPPINLGLALAKAGQITQDEAVRQADEALYRAKGGKNRIKSV